MAAAESEVESARRPFVPWLELVPETLIAETGFVAVEVAALRLSFDYGGTRIGLADRAEPFGPADGRGAVARDWAGERAAQRELESFGAVEVEQLGGYARALGGAADYVVDADGDPQALCHFGAHVVPRLRERGWRVETLDGYPCRIVAATTWFSTLSPDEHEADWFDLQLGVEVDGRRVDLLAPVLELLSQGRAALARLERSDRPNVALRLEDGVYLAVPTARMRLLLGVLLELYEIDGVGRSGALRLPAWAPEALDDLEQVLGPMVTEGPVELVSRMRAFGERPAPVRARPPVGLCATLRPYQQVGLGFLQQLAALGRGGILADDMGLGKTLQVIAFLCGEREAGRLLAPALVVAPTSVVGNWSRELRRFAPGLAVVGYHGPHRRQRAAELERADVIVTSYPVLVCDHRRALRRRYAVAVLDEAQTIKNRRSRVHAVATSIQAEQRLALTGTPIENNLDELWAISEFANPGLLGDPEAFAVHFRIPIETRRDPDRLETLRRRLGPFVLRRLKQEVATELPPKTELVRSIELHGEQRELYESIRISAHAAVRTIVRKKGLAASTIDILGALTKLRQVCCDPRLVPVDAARAVRGSAKLHELMNMLPRLLADGRRVLLFSQFTSMLALIAEALRGRGIRHLGLTGSTRGRQAVVDAFEAGRADVFLVSLKAGGTGLNLTSADTVIHYDPWWNPAAQAQATDRAHRIGQKKPVFVYDLVVTGSVEERMLALQRRKRELADLLLSGTGEAKFAEEDVEDLFSPLSDG